jgi:hypothetical protein
MVNGANEKEKLEAAKAEAAKAVIKYEKSMFLDGKNRKKVGVASDGIITFLKANERNGKKVDQRVEIKFLFKKGRYVVLTDARSKELGADSKKILNGGARIIAVNEKIEKSIREALDGKKSK